MSQSTEGPIKGHLFVPTDDGSVTLYSEAFNEACHSTYGAKEETKEIYLEGCDLVGQRARNPEATLRILEIGFGAGIGVIETLKYSREKSLGKVHMITTEIDASLVDYLLQSEAFSEFAPAQTADLDPSGKLKRVDTSTADFRLTILVGDAREALSIPALFKEFSPVHAIYQDAFSPKRNPALWSKEWFCLLGEFWSDKETLMSTYSASNSIRKAMAFGGWGVSVAKGFGPKRQSTRAKWCGEISDEMKLTLERSGAIALEDENLRKTLTALK